VCQDHAVTTALCCRWGGMLYEAVISQYVQSGVAYWVGPGYWMRWHVLSIYTRWRSRMSQLASAGPHFGYLKSLAVWATQSLAACHGNKRSVPGRLQPVRGGFSENAFMKVCASSNYTLGVPLGAIGPQSSNPRLPSRRPRFA